MGHFNFAAYLAVPAVLAVIVCSCGTQRKAAVLQKDGAAATLSLAGEKDYVPEDVDVSRLHRADTIRIEDFDGRQVMIMKAIRDEESGEMVAHEQIDAAVVTARFRNLAERQGKVDLRFQIKVPAAMQDSKWQLRFYPDMFILNDSIRLDPVYVTGKEYRRAQLRGYERYRRFLESIITDTTKLIHLGPLEAFIARNIPELYAFRTDSSLVSDDKFASVFGVTEKEAIDHYTSRFLIARNQRRLARRPRMFDKYVKSPIVTEGIRLDTVMVDSDGDYVYEYVQTINTRPKLRRVDIILSGDIWQEDRRIYTMARSEPLTFYISSLSAFADHTERYLTTVIERSVESNTSCHIEFPAGRSDVDVRLADNAYEIKRIESCLRSLMGSELFDLDSIVVMATASPEGSVAANARLSLERSRSVSKYFGRFMDALRDSLRREAGMSITVGDDMSESVAREADGLRRIEFIAHSLPENWDLLDLLVRNDTVMSPVDKESYRRLRDDVADPDRCETMMRAERWYAHMRNDLYPRLREVNFDFHLHRRGMVKDTVHTTVLDSTYMRGVQALDDRDYDEAIRLLGPYRDFNAAIAYSAMNANASAKEILEALARNAEVNYLLAIIYAREGDDQKAVQCYLDACREKPQYVHRGNLDPEISALVKAYGLNRDYQ